MERHAHHPSCPGPVLWLPPRYLLPADSCTSGHDGRSFDFAYRVLHALGEGAWARSSQDSTTRAEGDSSRPSARTGSQSPTAQSPVFRSPGSIQACSLPPNLRTAARLPPAPIGTRFPPPTATPSAAHRPARGRWGRTIRGSRTAAARCADRPGTETVRRGGLGLRPARNC